MKKKFKEISFRGKTQKLIRQATTIIDEYMAQGLRMTVRQLHYQFVSRDLYENTPANYTKLTRMMTNARATGHIDWDAIEDRTRALQKAPTWKSPEHIIRACIDQYRIDKWANQDSRVEVWIEKKALANIFADVCDDLDVGFFACSGYTSSTEIQKAGDSRMARYIADGQYVVILHFGDHDPSGVDMTRDIRDRLSMFASHPIDVRRIALNMDQIQEYAPPPNFTKDDDSRRPAYEAKFGQMCWELDALPPPVLHKLILTTFCNSEMRTSGTRHSK